MDIFSAILGDANISPAFKGAMAGLAPDPTALPVRRAKYVADLIRMDWTFEASSDQRVWQRGRDELQRLRAECDAIAPDRTLWIRHAHSDYRFG